MPFKLHWSVRKNSDGSFSRRGATAGDSLGLEHIDVEWTHEDGFPHDTFEQPIPTWPPTQETQTVTKQLTQRKVIRDQISVPSGVPDSTVCMILDEKRPKLAKSLGIEP